MSKTYRLGSIPEEAVAEQITLDSDTGTAGSDALNHWQFEVFANGSTALLSAPHTTDGAEIVANTAYVIPLDQNLDLAEDDVISVEVTKVGNPTPLAGATVTFGFAGPADLA